MPTLMFRRILDVLGDVILHRERCPHCWERLPRGSRHAHMWFDHGDE